MTDRIERVVQGIIFVGWGGFLLHTIVSGKIAFYINQRYIFLVFLGVLAFTCLGLVTLVNAFRSRPPSAGHDLVDHRHEQDGSKHLFPIFKTLVIGMPLLIGLMIPARPLGSSAMTNRGVDTATPLIRKVGGVTTSLTQSTTGRSVLDWVGLFNSASDPAVYKDQAAQVTGFVYHDPRLPKNQFFVSRFVITCCVADASALGMLVNWKDASQLTENGWVEVKGSIFVASMGTQTLPGITAEAVSSIPTPDQPYLFP
jgi:uncharacterized repeat protein (TIGR03943 family)